MGFLSDKKVLIVGVASNRSIAYGVAQAMRREGAMLGFTYQGEKLAKRVEGFADEFDSEIVLPMDVASDDQINEAFDQLSQKWDGLDCIVHSVGFAPRDQLEGSYVDSVSREGFQIAHDISSYSLAALAKAGKSIMKGRNGSILTMSYLGSIRTIPNYNVMGVAKASLEANVRIARYHNIYGPEGTYEGGREKAPAALCRKIINAKLKKEKNIEVWGDGEQTRSFLYIDDCIDATMSVFESEFTDVFNIGSEEQVSINQMIDKIEEIAVYKVNRKYDISKPKGVRGRSSDNSLINSKINWSPKFSLNDGLEKTYKWIYSSIINQKN